MITQTVHRKVVATGLAAVLLATSCASFQIIEPRKAEIQRKLYQGDTARIVTKDGTKLKLRVLYITAEAISGKDVTTFEDRRVLFDDISVLEKKVYREVPILVYGVVGIVVLVACANSSCIIR